MDSTDASCMQVACVLSPVPITALPATSRLPAHLRTKAQAARLPLNVQRQLLPLPHWQACRALPLQHQIDELSLLHQVGPEAGSQGSVPPAVQQAHGGITGPAQCVVFVLSAAAAASLLV